MKIVVSGIMLIIILVGMFSLAFNIQPVKVNAGLLGEPSQAGSVDWWPMFHHDLTHTGYSTSSAPKTNQTLWSYTTGGGVSSSPAVADGVVYVGSYDGNVYALDASTGALIWSYPTRGAVDSSPAVADGKVFVGSYYGNVYALNATTGARVWDYTTGINSGVYFSSPAVADGVVYVGSMLPIHIGNVYALNASTGAYIWSYTTIDGWVLSSPAVADGVVYVGSEDCNVYALDASTGAYVWSYTTGNSVSSSPAVADGIVYVGSRDGNVYALNASTGAYVWSYTTTVAVRSSPAVVDGVVYVGSNGQNVYALNASTGALVMSYTPGGQVHSSPAVADGVVFAGSTDNRVYAFDATTGALVWSYLTGGFVESSPAVVDGIVYVGSLDGKVYAFGSFHDVAVTDIKTKTVVGQGNSVPINVTVQDQGTFTEDFNVTIYANTTQIGKQNVTNLNSGTSKILSFTWNTTGFEIGNYTIKAVADVVTNETDISDNTYIDGIVTVRLPTHDVAVSNVTPSKTVICQGYCGNSTVTAQNLGDFTENFNVTVYANTTVIGTLNFSLTSGSTATQEFVWNTTGFAYGNYTLSAYAPPVLGESEIDTANNNCTDGWVIVSGVGDIVGSPGGWPDGITDMMDIARIALGFMCVLGDSGWKPNADINNDGIIDISDMSIAAMHFMQTWPYPPYP